MAVPVWAADVIVSLAIVDDALLPDVEPVRAFAAAYAVICERISISFARVASSIEALDALRVLRLVPDVPVAVPDVVPAVPVAVSLPARFVMMRSIAATSVPQLCVFADAAPRDALLRLDD